MISTSEFQWLDYHCRLDYERKQAGWNLTEITVFKTSMM
jgi:hypothetical protein